MNNQNLRSLFSGAFLLCLTACVSMNSTERNVAQDANSTDRVTAQVDASCRTSNDPNEVAYRFNDLSQKYARQCIDSTKFRAIQNFQVNNNIAKFNNYQHAGEFWEAQIPIAPGDVEKAYFLIERFPIAGVVEAAHTEIRFVLKKPIQLTNNLDTNKKTTSNDVLITFEAARPRGEAYNFALGTFDNYAMIGRVLSAQEKNSQGSRSIEQYDLDLTQDEKAQLLQMILARAARAETKFVYNTLRPNCTTEVFDSIDALPRFQGRHRPFMTVISNDPIAKPSIKALQARNILKARIQNFEEEIQGITKTIPVGSTATTSLLPQVNGHPWTMIVTLPRMDRLTPSERAAIVRIRSQILQSGPLIAQGLGSALMTQAAGDTNLILANSLGLLQRHLLTAIQSVNNQLPNTRQNVGLYLVPFAGTNSATSLQGLGIPAELPFAIRDLEVDESIPRSRDVYMHVAEGTRKASDVGVTGSHPAYLMGGSIQLKLQRDHSQFHSQLLVGLKDMTRPFEMTNSQVRFRQAVISGSGARGTRPTLLMTHSQTQLNHLNQQVQIEFGPAGGITGMINPDMYGTFQILKDFNGSCATQAASSPTLIGNLADAALNKPALDRLLAGKPVSFQIVGAKMNMRTLQLDSMDVRVSTWPLQCLSVQNVNDQFRNESNQMLQRLQNDLRSGALMNQLMNNAVGGRN